MPLSVEDDFKLLASYCLFNGDADKVAIDMGITMNSVNKCYAKLISDEKEKATELGFLDGGAAPAKKRVASGGGRAAKKTKNEENSDGTVENGNEGDDKVKGLKDEDAST